MVGIARHPVPDDLGIDLGAARFRALITLEHHDPGALAHDEAITPLVVGPGGFRRRVVVVGRKGAAGRKTRQRDPADRAFRPAGNHHLGISKRHQPCGITDGMGPGRARRHHGMVRTLETVLDRNIARREIDQASGNEERADPPRTLVAQQQRRLRDTLQPANAGADQNPDVLAIGRAVENPLRIRDRLVGSGNGIDDEVIDLALLLGLHPRVGIERAIAAITARHEARDLAGEVVHLEFADAPRTAFAGKQSLPGRLHPASERCDGTQPRDDDASHMTSPSWFPPCVPNLMRFRTQGV